MDGATGILIKLGVRLAIFGAVFYVAARRNPKIILRARWATPLVAVVFALLNVSLYWAITPLLDLATLGAVGFLMPLIVNALLLVATVKLFAWRRAPHVTVPTSADGKQLERKPLFEIAGLFATLWMALILTVAHGVLWVALDYIPSR
jgi:hypothetical protein